MSLERYDKPKIISFARVCRICLRQTKYLKSIYKAKMEKMFEYCATIKILENDGMPENVCIICFRLIAKFYQFKLRIEKSDKLLRGYLEKEGIKLKQNIQLNKDLDQSNRSCLNLSDKCVIEENNSPLKSQNLWQIPTDPKNTEIETDSNFKLEDLHIEEFVKFEDLQKKVDPSNAQIFSDGPPPLVPLNLTDLNGNCSSLNTNTLDLAKDTPPPLIPIKALGTMEIDILNDKSDLTFSCTSCQQQFNSLAELKQHKLTICHPKLLECNVCKKEFQERRKLIGHLKGHMVTRKYECKICGKKYPNPSTFRVHIRTHTGERPYKCQICAKGFVKWAGVVNHMKTHKPDKPFECKTCGKRFKVSSNLERHKVLHNDVLPFCCNFCGRTFSQSGNLQLHIRTNHTNERPHVCCRCGKRFVSTTRLNRHMWTHNGYKPYVCNLCPKSYTNTNDLKLHQRNHMVDKGEAEKQYACAVCGMKFFHKCRLARHVKTHNKPFNCDKCAKGFKAGKSLKKHISKAHSVKLDEQQPIYINVHLQDDVQ